MRVSTYTDVNRVPELPERVSFSTPWRINRKPALWHTPQDVHGNYLPHEMYESVPAEKYFTRMDEVGQIYIWHPEKNTLRCI